MGVIQIFIDQTIDAFKGMTTFQGFDGFCNALASLLWSPPLVILLVCTGIYFSIRMAFPQVRKIKKMVTLLFGGSSSEKGVSSFQAFAMAVAGRVGTGNIVGVATAIAYGGPGAVFWMWMIAFLGSGSAFVEATLAQIYKDEIDGEYRGSPALYFGKRGLGGLKIVFIVACIVGCGIALPGIQSNAIATAIHENFGVSSYIPMIITVVLLALIIIGGTKSIAKAAEVIVPFMSGIYILAAIIIIIVNIGELPRVLGDIFGGALGLKQALAGTLGWAILWGVKRGVFSNEAGQGTAPHVAAAAEVSHPAKQGLVQAFSVYFDTLFVCSATAFAILMTGTYQVFKTSEGADANGIFQTYADHTSTIFANVNGKDFTGSAESISMFTPQAFNTLIHGFGGKFVAISLFFFAFTTLMALYYYAESDLLILLEKKTAATRKAATWILKIIYLFVTGFFAIQSNAVAWAVADIGVACMAWINVIGILIIAAPAIICFKDYERREKAGTEDEFFTIDSLSEEEQKAFKGVTFWHTGDAKKVHAQAKE
ncbi:MAG: alanine:cation symporter family protein [Bacilli bacterium]|jgi:AGCS family alanine or glycine:cation symporter|nr:alanine:cation symporter family protein [Bacilli bacterium]